VKEPSRTPTTFSVHTLQVLDGKYQGEFMLEVQETAGTTRIIAVVDE
jgi:hypothetical protein